MKVTPPCYKPPPSTPSCQALMGSAPQPSMHYDNNNDGNNGGDDDDDDNDNDKDNDKDNYDDYDYDDDEAKL